MVNRLTLPDPSRLRIGGPPHAACGARASFYNDAPARPSEGFSLHMIRPSRPLIGLLIAASLAGVADARKKKPRGPVTAPVTVTTIGVNAYLWRAALDTLSFMSIAQTDSNGGVIITNWYVNPQVPSERMKVSVAILDAALRADVVRVSTARQVYQNGQWVDAAVQASTNEKLEEIILQKARDLRRNASAQG